MLCLQSHHLDPVLHQLPAQFGDRAHGGGHLPDLAVPAAVPAGQPDAYHPGRLGHVDGGDPVEHPLLLVIFDYLRSDLAHRGHLSILDMG